MQLLLLTICIKDISRVLKSRGFHISGEDLIE